MHVDTRFNFLVVDPDSASRGKLKQVALALTTFNKVYTASSIAEALTKTSSPDAIDVVALSYRFSQEEINKFIDTAKETSRGAEWAYMLVLKTAEQKNEVIATNVIGGVDGFLFEPYSADNLREMAEITAKVKMQNENKRKKAAMIMLLNEVCGHLDAVSFYKSKGRDPVIAQRKLNAACESLRKFKGETFSLYIEAAIDIFSKAQPVAAQSYKGASKRVREKLESKMLEDLEKKYF